MSTATPPSPRTYLAIWGWLAGLMLLSVLLSELPLSGRTIALIVLALSTVKALLVALYYMHLKFDRRWLAFVAVFPLILVVVAVGVVASSRLVRL
ncbi:MAG: cytochrome C oxidase subunit IV family protein [Candidatus Omnitrophica bacterium]|nr:cytochrome C oxidase subunit IV family protein [Candidatus Omnitrophota bacterium]